MQAPDFPYAQRSQSDPTAAASAPGTFWFGRLVLFLWCASLPFLGIPELSPAEIPAFLFQDDGRERGSRQAPVTLVEYSDFTCGYCFKFFQETWPRIRSKYVETGKVRFVYRDFPRSSRGPGYEAAVAARCAGEQGRYWPMHDRLFGDDRRIGSDAFFHYAKAISLDLSIFQECLEDDRHREGIFRDKREGLALGFRGTPGFALLRTDHAQREPLILIPGALPFEVFEQQLERLLDQPPAARKS